MLVVGGSGEGLEQSLLVTKGQNVKRDCNQAPRLLPSSGPVNPKPT